MEAGLPSPDRIMTAITGLADRLAAQPADVQALARAILETAVELLNAEAGSVLVADRATEQLVFEHAVGPRAAELIGSRIPSDAGIAGRSFTSGDVIVSSNAQDDARHLPVFDDYQTNDMITVPIWAPRGVRVGVLQILNSQGSSLGEGAVGLLKVIAALAALLIESSFVQRSQRLSALAESLVAIHQDVGHMTVPLVLSGRHLRTAVAAHVTQCRDIAADLTSKGIDEPAESLTGSAEVLVERSERALAAMQRGAERIHERSQQAARCAEGATLRPRLAEHDVGEVVRDAAEVLCSYAQDCDVQLEVHERAHITAELDGHQLFNAVYNLLRNAIAHTSGGGRVWAAVEHAGEGRYAIEVGDTGSGIPSHVRHRLFGYDPADLWGDLHLGTRMVGGVVRSHFGKVSLESEVGHGTVVRLTLPLSPRSE